MKYNSFFKILLFSFVCAFIATSCVKEGPAGVDGEDGAPGANGANGQDGEVTCLVCHSGTNMDAKKAEFAMSAHSVGAIAVDYAGGRASCAKCHSHEGFIQYAVFGKVLGDITNPSAWECSTCHGLHKTFENVDYAMRMSDPVISDAHGSTNDMGHNSNLCATCHQSRTAEPNTASPGETFKISSIHYGPHHGAQSNVVAGIGFAEIDGPADYPTAGSNYHLTYNGEPNACTGCHMGTFDAVSKGGGHTYNPNLSACIECHDTEMDDFNYGGRQTVVEELLVELRDLLIEKGVVEYVEADDAYEPIVGTYPMLYAQAYYNWIGLEEDRSLGAHNPKYVTALLTNSIDALKNAE